MSVWEEVEEALDKILEDYEKINHIISLFQDDKVRLKGLSKVQPSKGSALELGSGPGNYSRMILKKHEGPLVCLDYSNIMLYEARRKNKEPNIFHVRAVFDALPFRDELFHLVTTAYALRDSVDIPKAVAESYKTMTSGGSLLIIDIGKPDNILIQRFMRIYIKYLVPIISGLFTDYGYRNPWSLLYKTFDLLPSNKNMSKMLSRFFIKINREEFFFGALIAINGKKK
jgi:demethylmenaquinone methyltransferase/2-methoxy-6-polyprenyl-1,4-benzoquinol methylase